MVRVWAEEKLVGLQNFWPALQCMYMLVGFKTMIIGTEKNLKTKLGQTNNEKYLLFSSKCNMAIKK